MTKIAFVFPGQGSQSVSMLAQLAEQFPVVQSTFTEASEVLGLDLWQLTQNGPAEELNQTKITQPAMLAADIAVWRCWQQQSGQTPSLVAGHSLGEYAALVAAGAISYTTALNLVKVRAEAMQAAVPVGEGAMVAIIGLEPSVVAEVCQQASSGDALAEPANFNAPGQIVVAGNSACVEKLLDLAKKAGARIAKQLPMSVPSHCSLMQPAVEPLTQALAAAAISAPTIEVLRNIDAKPYTDAESIRQGLELQIIKPVQWVDICTKISQGAVVAFECGPGKVLCGLAKRAMPQTPCTTLGSPEQLQMVLNDLLGDK